MLTTNFSVNLLAGETLKVAGPGTVEFAAPEVVGAGKAAFAQGATGNAMAANGTVGGGAATITKTAASGGTIWSGKGLSLGLGLGLGAWGPVLLASAVGGYIYWRKQKGLPALPFKISAS